MEWRYFVCHAMQNSACITIQPSSPDDRQTEKHFSFIFITWLSVRIQRRIVIGKTIAYLLHLAPASSEFKVCHSHHYDQHLFGYFLFVDTCLFLCFSYLHFFLSLYFILFIYLKMICTMNRSYKSYRTRAVTSSILDNFYVLSFLSYVRIRVFCHFFFLFVVCEAVRPCSLSITS